jgi:hypothetical protein
VQPAGETSEAPPSAVPAEPVTKAIKPTGTPVEIRRAIPVTKPSPRSTEPEVRRAEPAEEDESN